MLSSFYKNHPKPTNCWHSSCCPEALGCWSHSDKQKRTLRRGATALPVPVQHCEQLEPGRGQRQGFGSEVPQENNNLRNPSRSVSAHPLGHRCRGFPKALQDSSAEVTGRRWLEWGQQHGGPSDRSLCVEVDRLDFSRQDLGNLHRDDLGHHFRVVHAHHVCLD